VYGAESYLTNALDSVLSGWEPAGSGWGGRSAREPAVPRPSARPGSRRMGGDATSTNQVCAKRGLYIIFYCKIQCLHALCVAVIGTYPRHVLRELQDSCFSPSFHTSLKSSHEMVIHPPHVTILQVLMISDAILRKKTPMSGAGSVCMGSAALRLRRRPF
jgi:hypothetical protein